MYMERSIPCALNARQLAAIFRDLGRIVEFEAKKGDVAVSPEGLVCRGWDEFPPWVRSVEVRRGDGEISLLVDAEENANPSENDALIDELTRVLAGVVGRPVRPFPRRVFCLGWQSTGTTSITEALRMLGLFSWHFAPWVIGLRHRTDEVSSSSTDLSGIADYTAVADLPVSALFKELDEAFPGSLFILTTRRAEVWLESAWNLAQRIHRRYGNLDSVIQWAYGTKRIDRETYRDRYDRHNREVLEYFGDRKDLLVIDVTRGNPWPALCEFLKLPEPDAPFPHLNRRPAEALSESR